MLHTSSRSPQLDVLPRPAYSSSYNSLLRTTPGQPAEMAALMQKSALTSKTACRPRVASRSAIRVRAAATENLWYVAAQGAV